MDYGRPLEFWISIVPEAEARSQNRALVHAADLNGLDLVGIQDHPYQRRFLDTWMFIATLLAETERIRIFPDVANLPLRPPPMIAKEAASLDVLSGGRFELGLGAGGFWDAIEAMGGPRRAPAEAVSALAEAIEIIRQAWSGARAVQFDGAFYRAHGYHPGPPPAHNIEIWIGAYKPRMLRLTGRLADGWLPSLGRTSIEQLAEKHALIDEGARDVGRDPSELRRLLNVGGSVGDADGADEGLGSIGRGLGGSADEWVDRLTAWVIDFGFDTFVFWPAVTAEQQVEAWAGIASRVRQEVAARRAGR
ncbi:MAG TPA: LLM class flavin-dependent oxidoreductase [Actinomycetota bacterium]|nr:LLM class flavin-dependent oxidoreductase [Actinomycetota bacterium]